MSSRKGRPRNESVGPYNDISNTTVNGWKIYDHVKVGKTRISDATLSTLR